MKSRCDRSWLGKESWKELAAFMEKRAKIEDDYARQVLNVVKTQVLGTWCCDAACNHAQAKMRLGQ